MNQLAADRGAGGYLNQFIVDITLYMGGFSQFNPLRTIQVAGQAAGNDDVRRFDFTFDAAVLGKRQDRIRACFGHDLADDFALNVQTAGKADVAMNHHTLPDDGFDFIGTGSGHFCFLKIQHAFLQKLFIVNAGRAKRLGLPIECFLDCTKRACKRYPHMLRNKADR